MVDIKRLNKGSLPKGTYAIGDLCCMININIWGRMCDIVFTNEHEGYFTIDGYIGWYSYTKYEDGFFDSNLRSTFPVDAGLIGAIQIEALLNKQIAIEDFNLTDVVTSKVENTGIFITELDKDTHPETNRFGTIMIGNVHIYTGENWYEEGDGEYEEDEERY